MIIKSTKEDKLRKQQSDTLEMIRGLKCYAWFPTTLTDGTVVWLEHYYRYYKGGRNSDGTFFLWSRSPEDYCPYYDCYLDLSTEHIDCSALMVSYDHH